MIIFYHSADLDGHCSGAIARMYANTIHPEDKIVMYGINYGDEFPWDQIKDEHVIMLDFSLQPFGDMIKLYNTSKEFIWIDHHISAIKECDRFGFQNILGIRNTERAACELAWEYFYPSKITPLSVYLLGRYDVWDHSDYRTLLFQYGMKLYDTDPNGKFNWNEIINFYPYKILGEGETVLRYVEQDNKKYVEFCSFETSIDNQKCIAINKMMGNSGMFDSVWDESKYDLMVAFGWKKDKWTVSLYTKKDNIDVSEIAKKFGGGGHKKAAGFQCDKLPFEI